jgi:hypothetical protein
MTDPRLRLVDGTDLAGQGPAVLDALDRVRVIIWPGPSAAANAVLVALAVRLFAHVELAAEAELDFPWGPALLSELMARLAWLRPVPATSPVTDRVVSVGRAGVRADLGVGGGAWTVRLAREAQPLDDEPGPAHGLRVAAALAVAELVKEALSPLGWVSRRLDQSLVWNLIDHQLRPAPMTTTTTTTTKPIAVAIGGVGSVGTSLIAALTDNADGIFSEIPLVDPEVFDARNPFRYPGLIDDPCGQAKVEWARQRLAEAGVTADTYQTDIASWVRERPSPGFDGILIASPDTVKGRQDVTDALARTTITVGVAGMAFHVSRNHLGDGLACPYCQCVPLGPASTQAGVYATQTGLSLERVLQLLQPGAELTCADIAAVRADGRLSGIDGLIGHRIETLVARAYAEIQLPGSSSQDARPVLLAAPHVSLIAGTIAAAEIRKAQLDLPMLDRRVDLDLTGLPQGLVRRPGRDSTGRCLCASPFRQRWMRQLYPETSSRG